MQNIFYGLRLFSNIFKGNICLLPLFFMSLGCVNYVLASSTLVDHNYMVLHAPGCGSLVILHVRGATQLAMKDSFVQKFSTASVFWQ